MYTSKSNYISRKNILITIVLAALLIGVTVYAFSSNMFNTSDTSNEPTKEQTEQEKEADIDSKKEFVESTKDQDLPGTNPPVPSSSDSVKITSTIDAGTVTIKSELSGFSSGSCELIVSNGTRSVVKNAEVIYQPEFSTCAGFSILKSELGTGVWKITLKVTVQDGSSISQKLEVSV